MAKQHELTGRKFGRLTALEKVVIPDQPGRHKWRCECECGKRSLVRAYSLVSGEVQSCGCLRIERAVASQKKNAKYLWKLPEYRNYTRMRDRCLNPKDSDYRLYGGRGIKVCQRWLDSFENFLEDMGRRSAEAYTIERIDVNGDYEPSNCRWASKLEQSYNTRRSRMITFRGETKCLGEWAKIVKIGYHTLLDRFYSGWDVERALTSPPDNTVTQFKKGHKRRSKSADSIVHQ